MNAPQPHYAAGGRRGTRTTISAGPPPPLPAPGTPRGGEQKRLTTKQDGENNETRDPGHGDDRAGVSCPGWQGRTALTVQALCSTQRSAPVADEMCEQYGIPQRTTNYFELLQWVDVIYLAVPNLQHYRYAKVALEAGKHVIVEKPMACTAAQTEELAALARRKKVFLFEAMTTQYLENYNKIRELLPRIGRVKLVQCNFSQYSSRYDAFCAGQVAPSF